MLTLLMAGAVEADRRRDADRHVRGRLLAQVRACCDAAATGIRRWFGGRHDRRAACR